MSEQFSPKKTLSWLFIVALATLFALEWGPGSKGCRSGVKESTDEAAATVNGKEIPLKDFNQRYASMLSQYKMQGLTAELARQLGLHKQVIDGLVDRELLQQAAEARGVKASNGEVFDILKNHPDFQKDGKFDPETFRKVLNDYYGTTEGAYTERLRRELSADKLLTLVENAAAVSPDEVKARYLKEGNKAKATFVRFNPTSYAGKVAGAKTAELAKWSEAHEKDIADYYAKNTLSYHQPERIKARQIVIRVNKEEGDAKKAEAKQKVDNLRKEIAGGKDFAEVAKQFSEDPETREKGGDMGFVERISLPPTVASQVFGLKVGEMTEAVETPVGYYLVKVEDKKAPETKPLDAVKNDIALQLWTREQAQKLAKVDAEKALKDVRAGKKLLDLYPPEKKEENESPFAMKLDLKPTAKETGEINVGSTSIPELGSSAEAMHQIFETNEPGLIDHAIEVNDSYLVVVVTERHKPSDDEFEKQKNQLTLDATKAKQYELRQAFTKGLKQSGSVVVNDALVSKGFEG